MASVYRRFSVLKRGRKELSKIGPRDGETDWGGRIGKLKVGEVDRLEVLRDKVHGWEGRCSFCLEKMAKKVVEAGPECSPDSGQLFRPPALENSDRFGSEIPPFPAGRIGGSLMNLHRKQRNLQSGENHRHGPKRKASCNGIPAHFPGWFPDPLFVTRNRV